MRLNPADSKLNTLVFESRSQIDTPPSNVKTQYSPLQKIKAQHQLQLAAVVPAPLATDGRDT